MKPETPKRTRLANDVKLAIIEAAKKKGCEAPPSPDQFTGWTEEETSVAALNASLTSATIRCSRSLLNEGFWEDDDFNDMTS